VRERVLDAIERIVTAEAEASNAPKPPEITTLDSYDRVENDPDATETVVDAFHRQFADDQVQETRPTSASEDFGCFGTQWDVPSVFWFVGGTDQEEYAEAKANDRLRELPTNHSPDFAPVIHPTLETGVETLVTGALAWVSD
jgi:metal-dependent amidase/aminoacylase/carboxypeptidase family protein